MGRVGQQIVGLDEKRLPDRVTMGVLTRVFPPGLVDEVVAAAKVGEQRIRILPAQPGVPTRPRTQAIFWTLPKTY